MREFNSAQNRSSHSLATISRWHIAASLLLCCITFLASVASADDLAKPTRNDVMVSKLVATLMQRDHLSSRELDDTISVRAYEQFIKMLDPMKIYFTAADIREFDQWKKQLDNQMLKGDYSAALFVFERFLDRVDQRIELAIELIDTKHDFTFDEEMITDRDLLNYAETDESIHDRWRKRIKYSLLVLRSDKKDESAESPEPAETESKPKKKKVDPQEQLRKRYRSFARRMHQTDTEDVIEMYITAITTSFDPHTTYMSRGSFENFLILMGLELEGIGATLQATDDGYTVIKNIVPGGAAATQGGLLVEDKIIAVAQGDEHGERTYAELFTKYGGDFIDATGMKLDDVVGMIRGKAGTVVRLSVMSENDSELHTVTIVREKIKLEDSAAHGTIFEEGIKADGTINRIGVIELPSFYASMGGGNQIDARSTTVDVKKILDDFREKKVDAVVLDLRRNGGGSLREAIDCTGLFIDLGPVVQVKNAYGQVEKHNDEHGGMSWEGPLVVLTSKFSASASEILAGAVQDYQRGLVVGDTTTHGKGTVQSLVNLSQQLYRRVRNPPNVLGALKITMQQFYRPNGDSTQKRGVLSDLVLPSITDKMDIGESDLDYPVDFDRVPSAAFETFPLVNEDIKRLLVEKSEARVSASEDFIKQIRKIEHYVEQKNLKSVSLNEQVFMERRRQLNAEKEDKDAMENQITPNREIERNYYLDEVLHITADYIGLLAVQESDSQEMNLSHSAK